jgi:hypothetical protein
MFTGIDFSGSARPWKSKVSRPTVWIACVRVHNKPVLKDLLPVQALDEAQGPPFERLVRFLAAGEFEACAIDAPFSLPTIHMPPGEHPELLRRVRELPNAIDRPFPLGSAIVSLGESICTKATAKPLRSTEKYWADRGVNTRSTMWSGPRGGAPFAAACLRLLERSERPCWPWATFDRATLVEAFPAAQLRQWELPYQQYSGLGHGETRRIIVSHLREKVGISDSQEQTLLASPDAIDAVVAAFAGIAVAEGNVVTSEASRLDGLIAVAN